MNMDATPVVSLWNRQFPLSLLVLILANLVPLAGVYVFGWDLGELLILYWAETGIIGCYTILKMFFAAGPTPWPPVLERLFMIPFFTIHFGGFMLGHGIFLFLLFVKTPILEFLPNLALPLFLLLLSHGFSFMANYIIPKEYLRAKANELMFAPYGRVVLMHVAIILGAFLGLPLVLLVLGKIIVDVKAHLQEHSARPAGNPIRRQSGDKGRSPAGAKPRKAGLPIQFSNKTS